MISDDRLDELLDALRGYFDQEREYIERAAQCETEADMIARQRHVLLLEAREAVRATLEAWLSDTS
ncbi:MAG: hypothetical protein ACRDIB_06425 [Ardenticatenaceae bacterium]